MALDRNLLFRLATSSRFEAVIRTLPPTAGRARRAAERYVAGESFADASRATERLAALGPVPIEQLLGVREEVTERLVARGVPVRRTPPIPRPLGRECRA